MNPQSIRIVIFDWAGTTVDFGSRAPAAAFANVFAAHGVAVTDDEARKPMGLNKREHLVSMLNEPEISARWLAKHHRPWNDVDVDRMYEDFVNHQLQAINEHATLVPELLNVATQLRKQGIKIGGTTGYFRQAAELVARHASEQGFTPDANACADDVPQGRPAPWMIYRVMQQLNMYPPSSVIKVGDTVADVQAGIAAGCWSIGVCDSSSLIGLTQSQYAQLPDNERTKHLQQATQIFRDAGSHAVIESLRELPALIKQIEQLQRDSDQRPEHNAAVDHSESMINRYLRSNQGLRPLG